VTTVMETLAKRRRMRKGESIREDIFMDEQI
jgi:hypothetical protein